LVAVQAKATTYKRAADEHDPTSVVVRHDRLLGKESAYYGLIARSQLWATGPRAFFEGRAKFHDQPLRNDNNRRGQWPGK
jgi:hypothetical protein